MITALVERIRLRRRRCSALKRMADKEGDPIKKEGLRQLAKLQKKLTNISTYSFIKSNHTYLTGEVYRLTDEQFRLFLDHRCMECGAYLEEFSNAPCSLCGSLLNQETLEISLPDNAHICMRKAESG